MEDNNTSTPMKNDDPSVTLTIRLIMQGKEVGSIIGKKGEIVNRFREESGAKINISDGSCPERIVTVSGTTSAIFSAFTLITKKFEEWCSQFNDLGRVGKTQIPIRLIVPASQCGSLIGKSGSKIKEIRQSTGCSIQVASEMLPNSTERAVTLSGSADQITQCIYQICLVMLESPPRGATIPYRPKPQGGPVILANGQAYTIQGNYAVPTQEVAKNPLASLAALGLAGMSPANAAGLNPTGKTNMENMKMSPDVSISEFSKEVDMLSPHYISKKQEDFLKIQKKTLKTGEFVVICDFSEFYSFVLQNAARSRYWSRDYCTIHPFSIYFKDDSNDVGNLSVIIIAESYTNFSAAFQLQKELLLVLRARFNDIKRIIFFADGAASHYKNRKNLYQLCQWKEEEHFDAEWHFFAVSLGKGPTCDGIGRAFKGNAMKESLQRPFENQLKNARELYEWAITKESTICYRFCSEKSFENVEAELSKFKQVKPITGIKKFHSFIPMNNREIKTRTYSTSKDFSIYKLKKT